MLGDCCAHQRAAARQFDRPKAERELAAYHRRGPGLTTRRLLAGLRAVQATGTLLDIGAGMGALTFELLADGIAHADCVEVAGGSLAVAQEEAGRRHLTRHIAWHEGDFVAIGRHLPPADIVALDKVVCCYPAFGPLLAGAAAHCRRWLALSFPRDRWVVRGSIMLENVQRRFRGSAFRGFVHPVDAMDALLCDAGFRPAHQSRSFMWHTNIYIRESESAVKAHPD
ncbi:MAG TPA: class I SAM-dependent methyltransferase [Gemmatimonadales bacterium]|jgi:magnesium-protoporphyrin O-methyltransferase|nr:class I SAM-dependent methyltransferase [Gemmatimonadales bacterium]